MHQRRVVELGRDGEDSPQGLPVDDHGAAREQNERGSVAGPRVAQLPGTAGPAHDLERRPVPVGVDEQLGVDA